MIWAMLHGGNLVGHSEYNSLCYSASTCLQGSLDFLAACMNSPAVLSEWLGTFDVNPAEYINNMRCRWVIPVNTSKVGKSKLYHLAGDKTVLYRHCIQYAMVISGHVLSTLHWHRSNTEVEITGILFF